LFKLLVPAVPGRHVLASRLAPIMGLYTGCIQIGFIT